MQIESREGLIKLPLDDLLRPGVRGTSDMTNWTQKMRDRFHDVAGKARAAGNAAFRNTMSVLSADGQPMHAAPTSAEGSPSPGAEASTPHAPFDAYGVDGLTDTDADEEEAKAGSAAAESGAVKLSHLHVNDTYGLQSPGSTAGAERTPGGGGNRTAGGFTDGNLLNVDGEGSEGDGGGSAAGTEATTPVTPSAEGDTAAPVAADGEAADGDRADPDDPFSIGP